MERASFELERLELDDGRLLVSGWWFGVRGMRFVRPALVVDGRKVLATLDHKPWAAGPDGSWTAAFPWQDGDSLDMSGVALVVAPSVEVPLDRETVVEDEPEPAAALPEPAAATPAPPPREPDVRLRDELQALERRLDEMRDELHETRAVAAEREARCRDLERAAVRDARHDEPAGDELMRAHAIAVLDRDRLLAQLEEAVGDREASVRTRARMAAQRDEAVARRDGAQARRDQAIAERDEARRQRDEVLLAQRALQQQLNGAWASAQRTAPAPSADERSLAVLSQPSIEQPSGVRVIPATRTVGAHLHRGQRERDHNVTRFDMWAIRILGSVAALAFISLLVMILKAFFVF